MFFLESTRKENACFVDAQNDDVTISFVQFRQRYIHGLVIWTAAKIISRDIKGVNLLPEGVKF